MKWETETFCSNGYNALITSGRHSPSALLDVATRSTIARAIPASVHAKMIST